MTTAKRAGRADERKKLGVPMFSKRSGGRFSSTVPLAKLRAVMASMPKPGKLSYSR